MTQTEVAISLLVPHVAPQHQECPSRKRRAANRGGEPYGGLSEKSDDARAGARTSVLHGPSTAAPDRVAVFLCGDSWSNHRIVMNHRNPDHHIWNNNGTWWCHYTEHLPDYTKRRVRLNLHTNNRQIARVLRDSVLFERFGACAL